MSGKKLASIGYAILAAAFYAINMPASKWLLREVSPFMMAALLYLGAGIGIGGLRLCIPGHKRGEALGREDLLYVIGMILLDILAPILLMYGLSHTTSATASLLNNFEIVATTLIALLVFREAVSLRLWIAIALVTLSSCILTLEDPGELRFSLGAVWVLLAAVCWGLENNCTRKISGKDTYQIVLLKGFFSGFGALGIAFAAGERLPPLRLLLPALLLGFVAYGLSIFFYVRAQSSLGAAKTSAYYAIAPFVAAFLSFLLLGEGLTLQYGIALLVMLAGSGISVADTLRSA